MIIRALDNNNDWTFGKGKNNYLKNLNALILDALTRLRSWREDCFFDTLAGVDYNNLLDVGTKNLLDRDVRRVILQTNNVVKINSFDSSIDANREYSARASIKTIYGNMEVEI